MNVAAVVRRLKNGGFSHDQAAILAEVLHDEIAEQGATKEHVVAQGGLRMSRDALVGIAAHLGVAAGLATLVVLSSASGRAETGLLNETLELSGAVLFLESKVPGLVIGAVRNGETAVLGFGKASDSNDKPPDGNTLIRVGSITKVFTGAALASFVAKGKLHFTDSLQDRLGWNVTVPKFEGGEIRLIDLATHASGLPRESPSEIGKPGDKEALGRALESSKLLFAPGKGALLEFGL